MKIRQVQNAGHFLSGLTSVEQYFHSHTYSKSFKTCIYIYAEFLNAGHHSWFKSLYKCLITCTSFDIVLTVILISWITNISLKFLKFQSSLRRLRLMAYSFKPYKPSEF